MSLPQPIAFLGHTTSRYGGLLLTGPPDWNRLGPIVEATQMPRPGSFVLQPIPAGYAVPDGAWLYCYLYRLNSISGRIDGYPIRIDVLDPRDRTIWIPLDVQQGNM